MKRETLKMIAAIGFTLIVLTAYSVWSYYYERNRLIAQIDKQLYSAAVAVPFVLESDFHDRAVSETSISSEEDNQNIKNLTKLNDQLGTKFLYTVILDQDGGYRLSSSSALASEIENHEEVRYFSVYPDVGNILEESFKNPSINFIKPNKIYKPIFIPVFEDQWGVYRTIFLPIRSLGGRLYVVGVDMDITYVNAVLRQNTIQTLLSFLLFLIAVIPIIISYVSMLKRKHEEYQEVHKLYVDQSKRSITDPLTQLYNRYKLDNELTRQYNILKKTGNTFVLLLLDLDFFKKINDQYGHDVGDLVLRIIAEILQTSCRATDTVGRWGGEEFMIIYSNIDLNSGKLLAEKIRLSIKESKELKKYHLTISIGVGISKPDVSLSQLIKDVDGALYQAKNTGRDRVVPVS
ncbi:diguanylate cyclase [uncultured Desulfuromusa sp.]|uniref:diguanylate cyclase n=1 Tax=uncultured Desulfuromusa sp. TaxID=219183 RepID=UPI002AA8D187|nr:diguanylate cyclase [uncultured Desulfuromusa sp.]